MKELPDCWHIEVTTKNKRILSKWYDASIDLGKIIGIVKWNTGKIEKGHNPRNITSSDGPNGYSFGREISFTEFERLVLGINKEKHYELW